MEIPVDFVVGVTFLVALRSARRLLVLQIVRHVLIAVVITGCATGAASSNRRGDASDRTVAERDQAPASGENTPENSAQAATPLLQRDEFERISSGLKEVNALSESLSQWALLLLGGALATVLSTSYHKPNWPWRASYFMFLPAFGFLVRVLERGSHVHGAYVAMLLRPQTKEAASQALTAGNNSLTQQMWAFQGAAVTLGIWTFVYLCWWLFTDPPQERPAKEAASR